MIKGQERKVEFPGILYYNACALHWATPHSSTHVLSISVSSCFTHAKCNEVWKLNPKTLITLNTCTYANGTVLCMCVSACVRAVIFPCELRWFCTAVFTDSFFFSPAPHLLEWLSLPPTQSLTQRAMFPSQFPMGYDSYSVEQQQGVYVCECVCVVRGDVGVWYPWHGNVTAM